MSRQLSDRQREWLGGGKNRKSSIISVGGLSTLPNVFPGAVGKTAMAGKRIQENGDIFHSFSLLLFFAMEKNV